MKILKHKIVIRCFIVISLAFFLGVFFHKHLTQMYKSHITTEQNQGNAYFEIDVRYEAQMSEANSNFEMCSINADYTEQWKEYANSTYNQIKKLVDNDFKQALTVSQQEWESFAKASLEEKQQYLKAVYGSGTIIPVLLSKYEYEIYRERAIDLHKMYDALCDKGTVCVNPIEK